MLKQMLDTNLWGLVMFTKEVCRDMRGRNIPDGHIVNIARSVITLNFRTTNTKELLFSINNAILYF